ncbi:MAG TPA: efflux RND transporter periplasmic adaptor subunit [Tepidisphaeraceae bacterium]|jgi:RND family efflux transporter MFP subunit|nr:efflux RND transporter periplasmic adaptor subunit [Tepidisphaeraceae bacterium]
MGSSQLSPPPLAKRHDPHGGAQTENGNGHADGHVPEHDRVDLDIPHARKGWLVAAVVAAALVIAVMLAVGLLPRLHQNAQLAADAQAAQNAAVPVTVVTPRRAAQTLDVRLPGSLRPWQEVSIFARTTGYLKKYYVDISNQVEVGQLMADIDSPEVDQQLRGSQASLQQMQASAAKAKTDLGFAETTWKRFESLKGTSGVTQQELDQYQSNYNSAQSALRSAEANVAAAEADVKRLTELKGFEKVIAPFSGVVTGRAYDVGALILANPTSSDTLPMFKIAENDVLRVFVNVPQTYALTIQKGMEVKVAARERPGREFTGIVMGTTNYLDPSARSLLTEVKVPNPDFALLPGMYVEAVFHVNRDQPPLIIPAPALVSGAEGNQVGVVRDGKVHFQNVKLGIDYGSDVEIVEGLQGNEQIIGNPGERTIEDAAVAVTSTESAPADGAPKPPPEKVAGAAK